jgi:hypothetical protein
MVAFTVIDGNIARSTLDGSLYQVFGDFDDVLFHHTAAGLLQKGLGFVVEDLHTNLLQNFQYGLMNSFFIDLG